MVAPWCTADDLTGPCTDLALDAGVVDKAIALASESLFYLTGSRWPGSTTETVRPMSSEPGCSCWSDPSDRRRARQRRRCPGVRQQVLPGYPVTAIVQVKIDGEVIDASRYRLDDSRWLTAVRASAADELISWPGCQAMDLPDSEDGTWSVRYSHGAAPPTAGVAAAGSLACEMALALSSDDDVPECRLPADWTAMTRAGISLSRDLGLTGLREVDLWIQAVNGAAGRQGAAVVIPGRPRDVRRTS